MTNNELALPKNLRDVVHEYNQKVAASGDAVKAFEAAGNALKSAATIGGVWVKFTSIRAASGKPSEVRLEAHLRRAEHRAHGQCRRQAPMATKPCFTRPLHAR
jgi:hypothetical protein